MKIKRIYNLAQRKGKALPKGQVFFVRDKVNPVIIVACPVSAVMNVGSGRKNDQCVGVHVLAASIQNHPCFTLDEQDKIVRKPRIVFNITGIWVVGVMAAVSYSYHKIFPFMKRDPSSCLARWWFQKSRLYQLIAL